MTRLTWLSYVLMAGFSLACITMVHGQGGTQPKKGDKKSEPKKDQKSPPPKVNPPTPPPPSPPVPPGPKPVVPNPKPSNPPPVTNPTPPPNTLTFPPVPPTPPPAPAPVQPPVSTPPPVSLSPSNVNPFATNPLSVGFGPFGPATNNFNNNPMLTTGFYNPGDFGVPFNPYATPSNPFAVPVTWGGGDSRNYWGRPNVNPNPGLYFSPNSNPYGLVSPNGNPYSYSNPYQPFQSSTPFYAPGTNPWGVISPNAAPYAYQMPSPYAAYADPTLLYSNPYGLAPMNNPYANPMAMDPFTMMQMQNMQMQNSSMVQPVYPLGPPQGLYPMNNTGQNWQMQLGGMNGQNMGGWPNNMTGMYGRMGGNGNISNNNLSPLTSFSTGGSPFGGTGGGLFGPTAIAAP